MTDDADYLVLFLLVILVMGDRWETCVCAPRDHKYTDMNDTSCFDG